MRVKYPRKSRLILLLLLLLLFVVVVVTAAVAAVPVAVVAAFTDATSFNNITPVNTKTSLNYTVFNYSLCTAQYATSVCYKKQSVDAE